MSYIRFHTQSAFEDSLYTLLKTLEAPHNDPKNVGDGDITIGLGFNLNRGGPGVQNAVCSALGMMPSGGTAAFRTPYVPRWE